MIWSGHKWNASQYNKPGLRNASCGTVGDACCRSTHCTVWSTVGTEQQSERRPSDTWVFLFPHHFSVLKGQTDQQALFFWKCQRMHGFVVWNVTSTCHIESVYSCRLGNKTELFSDLSGFPVLQERTKQIQTVLGEIQEHLKDIRLMLKAPALDYTTVSGQEVPPLFVCMCEGKRWKKGGISMMSNRAADSAEVMSWCFCVCLLQF